MKTHDVDELIDAASAYVSVQWPLDRSVAVNPLLDRLDIDFSTAVTEFGRQVGASLWPSSDHVAEAVRRGLGSTGPVGIGESQCTRPGTSLERAFGVNSREARYARELVGQVILEAVLLSDAHSGEFLTRVANVLEDSASWVRGSSRLRKKVGALILERDLGDMVAELGWPREDLVAELSTHFARLPGWAAWSKWSDTWRRQAHPAALSRQEFLEVSLAVDLAILEDHSISNLSRPARTATQATQEGLRRLEQLESMVHPAILRAMRTTALTQRDPRWQIVTCIDVRSEPLRRALEMNDEVETFGFAGFFGIPATVTPNGEREAHESLPVLVTPSVSVTGGPHRSDVTDSVIALTGSFAELTHEPGAMFALAEGSGWLGAPGCWCAPSPRADASP